MKSEKTLSQCNDVVEAINSKIFRYKIVILVITVVCSFLNVYLDKELLGVLKRPK